MQFYQNNKYGKFIFGRIIDYALNGNIESTDEYDGNYFLMVPVDNFSMVDTFGSPKAPLIAKNNMAFNDSLCVAIDIKNAVQNFNTYTKNSVIVTDNDLAFIPDISSEIYDIVPLLGDKWNGNLDLLLFFTNDVRENKIVKIKEPITFDGFKTYLTNNPNIAEKFVMVYFGTLVSNNRLDYSGTFEFTDQTLTAEELKAIIQEQLNNN